MPSLPTPGGDIGVWGQSLNNFLSVTLDPTTGNPNATTIAWLIANVSSALNPLGGSFGSSLVPNSRFASGTSGWSPYNSSSISTTSDSVIGQAGRASSTTNASATGIYQTAAVSVIPSTKYALTFLANVNPEQTSGLTVTGEVVWNNSGGAYISSSFASNTVYPGPPGTVVSNSIVSPSGAATARFFAYSSVGITPGYWIDITNVVLVAYSPGGRYTGTIAGDGTTTSFAVTHGLGNSAPLNAIYNGTQQVVAEFRPSSQVAGSFVFATAPASGTTLTYTLMG